MKWLNFKIVSALFVALLISGDMYSRTDYGKRIENYHSSWNKLIPRYSKIHFAGSMGLLSFGLGWNYAKHWETDLFLGFVPKYTTDRAKITFTLKQNYIPWNIKFKKSEFSIDPLSCGLYVNTVFGNDFWTKEPGKYPSGYYNFSTRIRFNIFIGQRITYHIKDSKRFFAKSITAYYELHTSDLYLVSAAGNRYLKPSDYLGLSLGLKFQIL